MKVSYPFKDFFSIKTVFPFKSRYAGGDILLISAWIFFVFTILSGSIRKWWLGPGALSNALFSLQLVMYFVFFLMTAFCRVRANFRVPPIFLIFITYLIAAALNPKNHTVYHGFFGIIIHLGFWVGLVAYYRYREVFEIEKLVGFFLLVLLVEVALGAAQYALPDDHILNIKANGQAMDAFVGSAVRVSGTFSYTGGYQVMVTFYAFLIWFLLVLEFPPLIILLVFGMAGYAALMSGSRGAMVFLLAIAGFAFVYTGFLFRRFVNVAGVFGILVVLLYFFGDNLIRTLNVAYENFNERVEWGQESGETTARFADFFYEIVNFRGKYPVYGIGLGSTYQGANAILGESIYAKEYGYYEAELGRIVLEGGYILFFLRIILIIVLLRYSYIPSLGKVVVVAFFLGAVVVFSTYQGVFFLFGLLLVDRAYYLKQNKIHPAVN